MFRELEYQTKVFDALDHYLEVLNKKKAEADKVIEIKAQNPDLEIPYPNFPEQAFEQLKNENTLPTSRANIPFSPRPDETGRPVPNITLKVPTGGGKTYIAVKATSKILNKYLHKNHGFILWVVPNEAIYAQTLKNFKDRDHIYRQTLDKAAMGRVKILEKTDRLNAQDVEANLCVMLLMLQSGNRQNKETLRIFRDRGDVWGFFPKEGDQAAHRKMVEETSNLDRYEGFLPQIKESLGNVLRVIRPVVVMDEGHKITADLAHETVYGFNPSFVLELSATPKDAIKKGKYKATSRYANLLIEITGQQLNTEGMIKMPLTLEHHQNSEWKSVLDKAIAKLNQLQKQAETYQANDNKYIRPIMLVQVERTGKQTRDSGHIHAEDVRDRLLKIGFSDAEIAIKTSEQNDLKDQNLLSPRNQIRIIITKEALQEGWDCPFAYILCALATRSNMSAMTQIVGRILRQPYAEKTENDALDRGYIFTHQTETKEVVKKVKDALEKDGLGDLVLDIVDDSDYTDNDSDIKQETIKRRKEFKNAAIFLPKILVKREEELKPLDYQTDILCQTNWIDFDVAETADNIQIIDQHRNIDRIEIQPVGDKILTKRVSTEAEWNKYDPVLVVRNISDIVLNPFVAREIIERLINALNHRGLDLLYMGSKATDINETLRIKLLAYQDQQAELFFKNAVKKGDIQFKLRADGMNWEMPTSITINRPKRAVKLYNNHGNLVQKSLFDPIYEAEMNKEEQDIALFLDEQKTLAWWHRNIVKRHYALQGWKKNYIYPDFIFAITADGKISKLVVLETKGEQLSGNDDTNYKRKVLTFLTDHFDADNTQPIGQLQLENIDKTVICDLVLMNEGKTALSKNILKNHKKKWLPGTDSNRRPSD